MFLSPDFERGFLSRKLMPMMSFRLAKKISGLAVLFFLLFLSSPFVLLAQYKLNAQGRKVFSSPKFYGGNLTGNIAGLEIDSPALPLAEAAKKAFDAQRYSAAKEGFKAALMHEPMNPLLWTFYDDSAVEAYLSGHVSKTAYDNSLGVPLPFYAIEDIGSHIEMNTLYVSGRIKNISESPMDKLVLEAALYGENGKLLKTSRGSLKNRYFKLNPNESASFEIPVKGFTGNISQIRVKLLSSQ